MDTNPIFPTFQELQTWVEGQKEIARAAVGSHPEIENAQADERYDYAWVGPMATQEEGESGIDFLRRAATVRTKHYQARPGLTAEAMISRAKSHQIKFDGYWENEDD